MKKMAAFLGILFLAGLIAAGTAAAFSYKGAWDGKNKDELTWVNELSNPITLTQCNKIETLEGYPFWEDSFDYSAGMYVVLKTGTLKLEPDYRHFAFLIESGDSFNTLNELWISMYDILSDSTIAPELTSAKWSESPRGKASHFTFYCPTTVAPIPGAVWLLGSGLLGLAGIRMRSKKKSA